MRRVMFTVAATVLIAGAVPASTLARHHHKHHARAHHAKIRRFGDQNAPATSTSPSDNAGKVVDFSNGVLTIQLNDQSVVKGMVTNDTEIECTSTQSQTTTHSEGDGSGDQSSGSGDQSSGSGDQSSGSGDQSSSTEDQSSSTEDQGDNDQNDAQGEDQNEAQTSSCSSSSLTDGAVVHEAVLHVGSPSNTWQKVELVS